MPPKIWMMYSSASTSIKIIRDKTLSNLYEKIMVNAYQERRRQNVIYTYDSSHNKHGKKASTIGFIMF